MQWKVHGQRPIYTSEWVNLWLEDVEIPGGDRFEHHALRMPRRSVAVVVFDETAEHVLMLWRHRFITDTWGWEIPAGWREADEPSHEAAHREVCEETGWEPGSLKVMVDYYSLPGISDLKCTLFRADGATHTGAPADRSESTRVEWIPIGSIATLIEDRQLTDGQSLTGLSLALAFAQPT